MSTSTNRRRRLRRLPRPRPGRAAPPPRARGDVGGVDGARRALRPVLRPERRPRQLRGDRRTGHVDARVVDGSRRGRRRARRVRGLASAGAVHPPGGGGDVRLGASRPAAARELDPRTGDAARRRVPRDAALHGAGRSAGDRGRCHARGLPRRLRTSGDSGRTASVREPAPAAGDPPPGGVGREQDPLPPSGRPGAGTAGRRDGRRLDRLVDQRGRVGCTDTTRGCSPNRHPPPKRREGPLPSPSRGGRRSRSPAPRARPHARAAGSRR